MGKYKVFLLVMFMIVVFSFYSVNAGGYNDFPLFGKTIYVDAGHPSKVFPK